MRQQPAPEAVADFILREVQASRFAPVDAAAMFVTCREVFADLSMETYAASLGIAADRINEAVADHNVRPIQPMTFH